MTGIDLQAELRRRAREVGPAAPSLGSEAGVRDLTQDGLALELGDRWANNARYVALWGRWYFWTGDRWAVDKVLEHMTRTRAFLRSVAVELEPEAAARRLRQADTVAKIVALARSNSAQAATSDQWDADPYHLGHPEAR